MKELIKGPNERGRRFGECHLIPTIWRLKIFKTFPLDTSHGGAPHEIRSPYRINLFYIHPWHPSCPVYILAKHATSK
jgi:hypothetical protein